MRLAVALIGTLAMAATSGADEVSEAIRRQNAESARCSLEVVEAVIQPLKSLNQWNELTISSDQTSDGAEARGIVDGSGRLQVLEVRCGSHYGSTEFTFYFEGSEPQARVLVIVLDRRYSSHNYLDEVKVASTSEHKLVLCGADRPDYPKAGDLNEEWRVAVDVLSELREANGLGLVDRENE